MPLTLDRPVVVLRTVQLELTGRCPLACQHCFTSSGPTVSHGVMTVADWLAVVDQLPGLGSPMVQLIGGEPTIAPAFFPVLERLLGLGLAVEVYTNLHAVSRRLWELLAEHGVSLATSYYSADPAAHDAVTGRSGSHERNRANIADAVRRGIPIRVGIVDVHDGQDIDAARADLIGLGVPADRIRVDRTRLIGRAAGSVAFDPAELCGACGHNRASVLSTGQVVPCTMARPLTGGDIRTARLTDLLAGPSWAEAVGAVPRRTESACRPKADGSDCQPTPDNCRPVTDCAPELNRCQPTDMNVALLPDHVASGCTPHDGSDCDPSGQTACGPDFDDAGA